MISVVTNLGVLVLLSLGATLVTWTSFLMLSNQTGDSGAHFMRMFVGWFLLITGWWFV